jgi:hypothetical protein
MLESLTERLSLVWEFIFSPTTIKSFFSSQSLWAGLFIGILWGYVLQKSRACKYEVVARLFLLQEFTIFRVGAPLILTMMVLLHVLVDIGIVDQLVVPSTVIFAQILGGLIMGAGIAISGYCPGTSAGALGEGALDALFFMFGMFFASAFFAEIYPFVNKVLFSVGNLGSVTIPDLLGINHWFLIIPLAIMIIMFDIGITMFDWSITLFSFPVKLFRKTMDSFDNTIDDLTKAARGAGKKLPSSRRKD